MHQITSMRRQFFCIARRIDCSRQCAAASLPRVLYHPRGAAGRYHEIHQEVRFGRSTTSCRALATRACRLGRGCAALVAGSSAITAASRVNEFASDAPWGGRRQPLDDRACLAWTVSCRNLVRQAVDLALAAQGRPIRWSASETNR